jgi:hypothetical protein
MTSPSIAVVVTSIQSPTKSMRTLSSALIASGGTLLVVGDKSGPTEFDLPQSELISLPEQMTLPFSLTPLLPLGHYARKNLGYLIAFARSFSCIYETDDDNAPNDAWRLRSETAYCQQVTARTWANVYRLFSDDLIWPRGFPLRLVKDSATWCHDSESPSAPLACPIQQGLADLSPDVDAAWRLLLDRDYCFTNFKSVWLPPGTWCPFNSQSTWWWPAAYPLMYLPSYCSFRMTDIWRSFVAQRCLWELGYGVAFHPPEVAQERNVHNLMKDFEQEIPGYLNNEKIVSALGSLNLRSGPSETGSNLLRCYENLVDGRFFPTQELRLVEAWLADIEVISQPQSL